MKFFYNERGQRIKKESYNTTTFALQSTTFYQLDLSGNTFAVYNLPSGGNITQLELPIYGLDRLGIYKKADGVSSYEIKDHLGNVRAVIEKESGLPAIKSYVDYYPFGELLPSRNALNYRYAFQGQELDQDTQMEAFQLRLWDGRLGRWISPDPMGQYSSPYLGMGNNPISMTDPNGGIAIQVVTALVGGVVNAGINIYNQSQNNQLGWNLKSMGRITIAFAAAAAGATGNLALAVATNVVTDVADQAISKGGFKNVNYTSAVLNGAISYGAGKAIGAVVPKLAPTMSNTIDKMFSSGVSSIGKPYLSSGIMNETLFNYGKNGASGVSEALGGLSGNYLNTIYKAPDDYLKKWYYKTQSFFNNNSFNNNSFNNSYNQSKNGKVFVGPFTSAQTLNDE